MMPPAHTRIQESPMPSHPRARRRLAQTLCWMLLCMGPFSLHAGELLGARFLATPEHPYVHQPFSLDLLVYVSPGVELQDLSLDGVPTDAFVTTQPFQEQPRHQEKTDNRTVDVLHYRIMGRATLPSTHDVAAALRASVVERKTMGFFSTWNMNSGSIRIQPFRLEFRPLPTDGKPRDFTNVVGGFTLSGQPSPMRVAPGDLVTVEYQLAGNGWLGQAPLNILDAGPLFKTYPPQELKRDENGTLSVRQVMVPLTTNATQITGARLSFFDPTAGVYREAVAGPFRLSVLPASGGANMPAIKHVDVSPANTTPTDATTLATTEAVWEMRRLLPLAILLVLSIILGNSFNAKKPARALLTSALIFAAGFAVLHHVQSRTKPAVRELQESVALRLGPSLNARILFRAPMGQAVVPVEFTEGWVRVEVNGRSGWAPINALKQKP